MQSNPATGCPCPPVEVLPLLQCVLPTCCPLVTSSTVDDNGGTLPPGGGGGGGGGVGLLSDPPPPPPQATSASPTNVSRTRGPARRSPSIGNSHNVLIGVTPCRAFGRGARNVCRCDSQTLSCASVCKGQATPPRASLNEGVIGALRLAHIKRFASFGLRRSPSRHEPATVRAQRRDAAARHVAITTRGLVVTCAAGRGHGRGARARCQRMLTLVSGAVVACADLAAVRVEVTLFARQRGRRLIRHVEVVEGGEHRLWVDAR